MRGSRDLLLSVILLVLSFRSVLEAAPSVAIFNVKDYGATGQKSDNALPAIQKAIDTCAAAGGGLVYLPPGEYTSGQIRLRSHVRFHLEAGATLFVSKDTSQFQKGQYAAAIFGEDLENISIEGRGTVDW